MKIIQKNYEGDMNGKDMARDKNKQISIAITGVPENLCNVHLCGVCFADLLIS